MGVLGGFSAFSMVFIWAVRGSPWLPIPLLPGYVPHAYKVLEWAVFYFAVLRPRFKIRAFPAFLSCYGFLEVFFNSVYLATHGGLQYGIYPYVDAQYPIRLIAYFGIFILGTWLGRVKLGFPLKSFLDEALWPFRVMLLILFMSDETGAIFVNGYNVVSTNISATAWTWSMTFNDLYANTLYLLVLWAVVYSTRRKEALGTPDSPRKMAQTPLESFGGS